ncbi:MAG: hypothetical protein ABIC04_05685 [Nanoarchaeota archaeon]
MIGIFDDINVLEPKCDGCYNVIKLGVTTKYHSIKKAHVCLECGYTLK